ncbi:plancitoxin-1-like [Drosophila innubila]|uniref:plancitoxin-1-like n=1 Tax=Drosophila innubila TaxID=198719 RepID=UPI00148BF5DA|nr:plancitoxin-1-like [Drosophila innubila]
MPLNLTNRDVKIFGFPNLISIFMILKRITLEMRLIYLLLLTVVGLKTCDASKVSCKDENGKDVDWWHMYLLHRYGNDGPGHRYLYVTSNDYGEWKLSNNLMGDYNSLPERTLNPLFKNDDILFAAYNEEFPNGTTFDKGGAAKGVIASDGDTGMWLVHSIPQYPIMSSDPSSLGEYGHSLLCLTLDVKGVEKVGDLLVLYEPHFYYKRNPLAINKFPKLNRALHQVWHTDGVLEKDVELRTLDGEEFRLFGRNANSQKELYADIIAPALDVSLFVRTYHPTYSKDNMPSICYNSNMVLNVDDVVCPQSLIHKYTLSWEDHSKWAVSAENGFKLFDWRIWGSDWICVGDLNRWETHQSRGGGAVCHKSSRVTDLYRKMVHSYEKCS